MVQLRSGIGTEDLPNLATKVGVSKQEIVDILYTRISEDLSDFSIDSFCNVFNFNNELIERLMHHPRLDESISNLKSVSGFGSLPLSAQLRLAVLRHFNPDRENIIHHEVKYLIQAYEMNPVMASYLLKGSISADNQSRENIHDWYKRNGFEEYGMEFRINF